MGRLEIRVCSARNVANLQRVGKPDPYVKVKMRGKKRSHVSYRTRVIENCLNPVWNEVFKFQVADYDSTQVLFELWNDNVIVDDLLGTYNLSINGLTRGVVLDTWVILEGTKSSSSELRLRILAVDFGRDPAPGEKVTASIEQDSAPPPTSQAFRPPNKYSMPPQVISLPSYSTLPPGPPRPVVYGAPGAAMPQVQYGYVAPLPSQSYAYGAPPPPQQPQLHGYSYGTPPQRLPYIGGPPPPPIYGPVPSPPRPVQMAYGIPPDV
ncbi:hypothetical protein LSCM4_03161 [Leishmania orientalis]|uniref:C2 domain-containing protein n=1 Tax=Leishmania orientalis TaxID=2249476 RepID=A0A836FYE6_9TRYP|nr:hypothetical protein LSCM4_03161 [Leishmania orientalis]